MAESFVNASARATGTVSTSTNGTIGAASTTITGITTTTIQVGDMVVNQHFLGGTKVYEITAPNTCTVTKTSTNTGSASSQTIKFLNGQTIYTSPAATKSILVGGTFSNLAHSQIKFYLEINDNSLSTNTGICNDIPIPSGSSFVISDAGKTILEGNDYLRVYVDTAGAVDVTLSILQGVK